MKCAHCLQIFWLDFETKCVLLIKDFRSACASSALCGNIRFMKLASSSLAIGTIIWCRILTNVFSLGNMYLYQKVCASKWRRRSPLVADFNTIFANHESSMVSFCLTVQFPLTMAFFLIKNIRFNFFWSQKNLNPYADGS